MTTKPSWFALGISAAAWIGWSHADARASEAATFPTSLEMPTRPAGNCGLQFRVIGNSGAGFVSRDGRQWNPQVVVLATNWRSVCRGNNTIVAIGSDGHLRTSSDNCHWTFRASGVSSALHRVAFGNGRFVAVGNEGALVTSEDGILWTRRNSGTDERLRGAAFGADRFVVVGYEGTILTSRDGRSWRPCSSGTAVRLQDAAYGNGTFVVVGWHGVILTSPTGLEWTQRRTGTTQHLLRVFIDDGLVTHFDEASALGPPLHPALSIHWWTARRSAFNLDSVRAVRSTVRQGFQETTQTNPFPDRHDNKLGLPGPNPRKAHHDKSNLHRPT